MPEMNQKAPYFELRGTKDLTLVFDDARTSQVLEIDIEPFISEFDRSLTRSFSKQAACLRYLARKIASGVKIEPEKTGLFIAVNDGDFNREMILLARAKMSRMEIIRKDSPKRVAGGASSMAAASVCAELNIRGPVFCYLPKTLNIQEVLFDIKSLEREGQIKSAIFGFCETLSDFIETKPDLHQQEYCCLQAFESLENIEHRFGENILKHIKGIA